MKLTYEEAIRPRRLSYSAAGVDLASKTESPYLEGFAQALELNMNYGYRVVNILSSDADVTCFLSMVTR